MIQIRIDGGQTMEYKDYIKQGLNGNAPLKLILCGNIQGTFTFILFSDRGRSASMMELFLLEQKSYGATAHQLLFLPGILIPPVLSASLPAGD